MKFAIIGLGNFGQALALDLTRLGHEVIAVDCLSQRVERLKNDVSYAIQLDSTDEDAMRTLSMRDLDAAIVAIGEKEGDAILSVALLRKLGVERVIARAISSLHQTVLEAMGIEEIIHPEGDAAGRLAARLNLKNMLNAYDLPSGYIVAEVEVPGDFIGQTIAELTPRQTHDVNIITLLREGVERNFLGVRHTVRSAIGPVDGSTEFETGDVMVVFGTEDAVRALGEDQEA
jgi:trk system potassium uptake protein TrkA